MPVYVMLTKLTPEGRRTVWNNPSRIREVDSEVESHGVKILSQYAVLGPYDFVNIVEAPDNDTVTKVALELGARGTIETLTMPAISMDQLTKDLA